MTVSDEEALKAKIALLVDTTMDRIKRDSKSNRNRWYKQLNVPTDYPGTSREEDPSFLRRMVNGFMWEFYRQAKVGIKGCHNQEEYRTINYYAPTDQFRKDCSRASYHATAAVKWMKSHGLVQDKADAKQMIGYIIFTCLVEFRNEMEHMFPNTESSYLGSVHKDMDAIWGAATRTPEPKAPIR